MKNSKDILIIAGTIMFFAIFACKDKTPKSNLALASIDLLRGELLLCSSEDFGEVDFSLSCSYETRETFNLALSLLHSFEYAEAEKAFVKVIDMDPDCAMAYWGVSMSIFHSLWMQSGSSHLEKGQKLLKIAQTLSVSEIEKDYLDAITIFYKNWDSIDQKTRKLLYEKKMEALYQKYQNDTEVAVFYALAIRAAADPNDKDYTRQKKAGKILEDMSIEQPNHPGIAHYIIHCYDYPELAERGLNTARRYAEIAPASAHAQHMPSHIFTRLGLWDESIKTNINSANSAVCYAESVNAKANWSNEIHAVDYLVYAYLQNGDNKNALAYSKQMQIVKNVFPKNDFAAIYALIAIPVRMELENKNWIAASKLELPSIDFPWKNFPWQTAMLHFGRALGLSHIGEIAAAEKELQILQSLHEKLLGIEKSYEAEQVLVQVNAAQAWINLAKGNKKEALISMKKATELERRTTKHPVTPGEVVPADELLGDMLLALNKPIEALRAYEINLTEHPNRFNGLYGAAIAAQQSGNDEKAKLYFGQLLKLTEKSNSDRPELKETTAFLTKEKSI